MQSPLHQGLVTPRGCSTKGNIVPGSRALCIREACPACEARRHTGGQVVSLPRPKFRSAFLSLGLAGGCALLVSACNFELDKLVPAIDIVQADGSLLSYVPNFCSPNVTAKFKQSHAVVTSYVSNPGSALPDELAQSSLVNKIITQSHYVSGLALQAAMVISKDQTQPPLAVSTPALDIGASEILDFGKLAVSFMRRTASATSSPNPQVEQFWSNLKQYYAYYFQTQFNTYLGSTLKAPSLTGSIPTTPKLPVSVTISDDQIVQAAQVFVEFLFDEILHPTVWATYDSSNNVTAYYPGGSKTAPTYLTVNSALKSKIIQKIDTTTSGCGMNVMKVQLMSQLVNQFGTMAAGEVALVVKSTGALEVGLGVIGKLNIGDNSLVSDLAKTVATEMASRLTVQFVAPILSAVDFKQQTTPIANALKAFDAAGGVKASAALKSPRMQALIAPFVGADLKTL